MIDAKDDAFRQGHWGAYVNTSIKKSELNCKFEVEVGFFPVICATRNIKEGEEFIVPYGIDNLSIHHHIFL